MTRSIDMFLVLASMPIRDAMQRMECGGEGLVVVTDADRRFVNLLTDGDVRRAILKGIRLESPVLEIVKLKESQGRHATTAPESATDGELLALMNEREIRHIPVVGAGGAVTRIVFHRDLASSAELPMSAVIMAGGKGTRLRPLTEDLPKPMLPVGDKPLMEHIVDGLRKSGIKRVNVTTHYLPERITEHFGDGRNFGVNLNYVAETQPLGTAGALSLMPRPAEPLLVINGDVLTKVDFRSLHEFHKEQRAVLTVAVRKYEVPVPFGVVECKDMLVERLAEKPVYQFMVNAGIYLLEPDAIDAIPKDVKFDMTDLIQKLLEQGRTVASFPILEYWLDVGQPTDYLKAQQDVKDWHRPANPA